MGTSNLEMELHFHTQFYTRFPTSYSKDSFPGTEVARAWS
jgi:hypothetical protein